MQSYPQMTCYHQRIIAKVTAVLSLSLVLSGCGSGEKPIKTVPVSGTVLYKGNPVEGATVSFWAEGAPRAATGITNEKGEFKLSMFKVNDGAMPGPNKVTVSKDPPRETSTTIDPSAALNNPELLTQMMQQQNQQKKTDEKPLLPPRYASIRTTDLVENVPEKGPHECVLQLKD
ncbi:MAG: hypothetical protein KatS3mg114_0203 [Planctomycetaceae bacterium]|nr:MAG: hypothetical protein KatS3mg114_0203 [Planctomycetaceae bacterium]